MKRFIPVAAPALIGNEKEYVMDCVNSNWISSNGKYIELFENNFAKYIDVKHALSCTNGTVALHLALLALGIGPGDEVIVPTLTYVATANAVVYCGAIPVFVDSENDTWNLNPEDIEKVLSPQTKAIIVVHLYGHPVDMDPVISLARKYGLFVIEDAAEAHGALYKGKIVGSIGDIATFSFYGNKIITTGEGGMVVTDNDALAARVSQLKGQGMDPGRRYWFPIMGYNYRMTNIEAAIGTAQLEKIDWHISRRREINNQYLNRLGYCEEIRFQPEMTWARNVYWMTSLILTEKSRITRDELISELANEGIESRPFFYPVHSLPMYNKQFRNNEFPVAEKISKQGLNIPSSAMLTEEEVIYVSEKIKNILKSHKVS